MAGVSEKSRGSAFAEQQLLRHGWEHGKGLGRAGNGISEPIKVKVKCDKGGVGHREGEQFSFHWWDHVFNKASSSLQVQAHQDGIEVKKTTEEDEEGGAISNRKPRKSAQAKDKLYGCFVKSATLLAGQEQPEPKTQESSSSSSDEEEEQKLDLSSVNKLSDSDLMKACGGRTAHKGARHGLTMSAKLARLEQQEAEFMARYGQRNQPQRSPPVCVTESSPSPEEEEAAKEHRRKNKKKKKKKNSAENCEEEDCTANDEEHHTKEKENNTEERVHSPAAETLKETWEPLIKAKKKKKKNKTSKHHNEPAEEDHDPAEPEVVEVTTTTKTSKKRKQKKEKHMNLNAADEEDALPLKKKRKKRSKTQD